MGSAIFNILGFHLSWRVKLLYGYNCLFWTAGCWVYFNSWWRNTNRFFRFFLSLKGFLVRREMILFIFKGPKSLLLHVDTLLRLPVPLLILSTGCWFPRGSKNHVFILMTYFDLNGELLGINNNFVFLIIRIPSFPVVWRLNLLVLSFLVRVPSRFQTEVTVFIVYVIKFFLLYIALPIQVKII